MILCVSVLLNPVHSLKQAVVLKYLQEQGSIGRILFWQQSSGAHRCPIRS